MTFEEILQDKMWLLPSKKTVEWLRHYARFVNGGFDIWPASCPGESHSHHAYDGGLAIHTWEVIDSAIGANQQLHDDAVIVVAGLFHDIGKIWDYNQRPDGSWCKGSHHKMVRHVARSFSEFTQHCMVYRNHDLSATQIENIEHCILSHHGRREWGSPVEPVTPEALLLHQADYFSAHYGKGR